MRRVIACAAVSLLVTALAGCGGHEPKSQNPQARVNPAPAGGSNPNPAPPPAGGGSTVVHQGSGGAVQAVRGAVDRTRAANDLANIAKFYNTYGAEFGKGPRTKEEFVKYIQRDAPQIAEAINKGEYGVATGLQFVDGNKIIAYTRQPTTSGQYMVANGSGSVNPVPPEEFQRLVPQP